MNFNNKLQTLRKERNLSQEEMAEQLGVSRQAVTKWEAGTGYPDIGHLIRISDLYKISLDRLLRESHDTCETTLMSPKEEDINSLVGFLCRAKRTTYAAHGDENEPSRPQSHDLRYSEGDYLYIDSYLGGEKFSGEEAVWINSEPKWAMNYSGRVLSEPFLGDFLKEALMLVPTEYPFRGPMVYKNGEYSYHCTVNGGFEWFQGYEEIFFLDSKVFECFFHGGIVR